jgi:hypothetical protein
MEEVNKRAEVRFIRTFKLKKQAQEPAADVCRSSERIDIPRNHLKRLLWLVLCLGSENKLLVTGALQISMLICGGRRGGENESLEFPETRCG